MLFVHIVLKRRVLYFYTNSDEHILDEGNYCDVMLLEIFFMHTKHEQRVWHDLNLICWVFFFGFVSLHLCDFRKIWWDNWPRHLNRFINPNITNNHSLHISKWICRQCNSYKPLKTRFTRIKEPNMNIK
jgi:hypothetical protein